MTIELFLPRRRDAIDEPGLVQLLAYWDAKRGDRFAPARADIDPLELGFVLGDLVLLDVEHEPLRFRIRLQGTNLVERGGRDVTGHFLDELAEHDEQGYTRYWLHAFGEVVARRAPWFTVEKRTVESVPYEFQGVSLPLSEDGGVVTMICGCMRGFARVTTLPELRFGL